MYPRILGHLGDRFHELFLNSASETQRSSVRLAKQRFEIGPHRVGDQLVAFSIRVNTIRQVQLGIASDAIQKEWNKRRSYRSARREQTMKFDRVIESIDGWRFHLAQQHGDLSGSRPFDDCREVPFHGCPRVEVLPDTPALTTRNW
jgi:hypothetical protein